MRIGGRDLFDERSAFGVRGVQVDAQLRDGHLSRLQLLHARPMPFLRSRELLVESGVRVRELREPPERLLLFVSGLGVRETQRAHSLFALHELVVAGLVRGARLLQLNTQSLLLRLVS